MFRSIAVMTDLSDLSRQAFEPAAALARRFGGHVLVMHVDPGPEIQVPWQCASPSSEAAHRRTAELEEKLLGLVRGEPSFQGLEVIPRILEEDPDGVLDLEDREIIDLLVLCSRAHEDVKHFIPGSFAARVLHWVHCPTLVLCAMESQERAASFDPRRILALCDFSPSSRAVLEVAAAIARKFHSAVEILWVVEPAHSPPDAGSSEGGTAAHLDPDVNERRERLLALASSSWGGTPPGIKVRSGKAASEVLAEAATSGADLIVMGSRGLSPVERSALGSVTESTIQNARCPVLVVKGEAVSKAPGGHSASGAWDELEQKVSTKKK